MMTNKLLFAAVPAGLLALVLSVNNVNSKPNTCAGLKATCTAAPDTMRKDPICGMSADDTKKDTVHYKNKVYAFCSKGCKEAFVKNPEAHLPKQGN